MQITCYFKFNAELNDFLNKEKRNEIITFQSNYNAAVKDAIESIGIPHPEIAAILANKQAIKFNYKIQSGDEFEVYPYYHLSELEPIVPIKPSEKPDFMLDVHLGGLARYLRMAGFNVLYNNEDWGDKYIADKGGKDGRIVLSRDIGLLKRSSVQYGYFVRNKDSFEQFKEIVSRYDLINSFKPFSRCIRCNGEIQKVLKEQIVHLLEEGTKNEHEDFWKCKSCEQIYWKGTHYQKMEKLIKCLSQES